MSIKQLFFLVLIFILSISSINAEESDESRKLKAESADKHIRFISPAEFSVHINKGLWIIMYGANWCKYTQKLTPKWLGLQTRIRAEGLAKDINIAKVECAKDKNMMDFCTSQGIDGFPTIYVYENGKKHEEYLGNHEINEMFTYVQEQVARYKSEEVVEEVVTVYVEEVVYEDEKEENKPRKSSREEGEQYQHEEANKPKPNSKQLPKKKNAKSPPPTQKPKNPPSSHQRAPSKNNQNGQPSYKNPNQRDMKQAPKYPPKNAPPKYNPPKYTPPKYERRPLPPKRNPNVVVKATKKVFGLVESLITLAIILIVIYAIVRFKAIKSHSSYSKTKIPLYRDLTQEEKYMLHYS
jgi:thiol-disulfide isomerase/thioredoxin